MSILNLTQHQPTAEQAEAGVGPRSARIAELLTIEAEILTASPELRAQLLESRVAAIIAEIFPTIQDWAVGRAMRVLEAHKEGRRLDAWNIGRDPLGTAMVGGAPYLVDRLVRRLKEMEVTPVYALSERVSVEKTTPEGVVKTQVFKHLGFIDA